MTIPKRKVFAISGAHSQGKTTLIKAISEWTQPCCYTLTSLTRDLNNSGLTINERGNDETQLAVINKHAERLRTEYSTDFDCLFLDRCALDGYAYTMQLADTGQVSDVTLMYVARMFELLISDYTCIFYVEPELPLTIDGQRSTERKFFDGVVAAFSDIIQTTDIEIVRVSGTVEERLKTIKQRVEQEL
jgi:predicted ATPase